MGPGSTEEQKEVVAAVLANPELAGVLARILKEVGNDPTTLAQYSVQQLTKAIETLPDAPPINGESVTTVDGHRAAVGLVVRPDGRRHELLLSEGSFHKSEAGQRGYAESLGYSLASSDDNHAFVSELLERALGGKLNESEQWALSTYRERFVRDNEGFVDVEGRRINWCQYPRSAAFDTFAAALFARESRSEE